MMRQVDGRPRPPHEVAQDRHGRGGLPKSQRRRWAKVGVYVLIAIWGAFVFRAAMARIQLGGKENEVLMRGTASDIAIYQLEVMDADEDLAAAIVPIIGRPIYHGATSTTRQALVDVAERMIDIEARMGR